MNYPNSQQMQMIQAMQAKQMQHLKEMQKINQLEKLNELENKIDKEKIRESVIKPVKIDKKNNMDDIIKNAKEKWGFDIKKKKSIKNQYDEIDDQFQRNLEMQKKTLQKERTNLPYKNIIKNIKDGDDHYEKHYKKFVDSPLTGEADKKAIEKAERDLLVHKVTNADKDGVEEELIDLKKNLEIHNDELKVIYSTSKEAEHKQKFEYNHKSKYRIKYDPDNHEDMKKDKINILKKEQKRMEKDKQKVDDMIQFLVDDGIFGETDVEKIINATDEVATEAASESPKSLPIKVEVNPTPQKVIKHVIKPQKATDDVKQPNRDVKQVIKPQPQKVEPKQIIKPQPQKVEPKQVIKPPTTPVKQVVEPKQVIKPPVMPVKQILKPQSTTKPNNVPPVQKGRIIRPTNDKQPIKVVNVNRPAEQQKKHIINNKKHIEL
jgi:hypothetical protein